MERTITPQQLKALHAWFTRAGWDADERHDFIETMTGGRTRSTRELTMREASDLLKRINTDYEERVKSLMQQEARALLRSIYHLSMQISFDSLRVNNVRCPLAIIGKDRFHLVQIFCFGDNSILVILQRSLNAFRKAIVIGGVLVPVDLDTFRYMR